MTRIIKRPARGLRGVDSITKGRDIVVIDQPGDECMLPPERRICTCTTCPANLTTRLPPGIDHATRCALDQGELIHDPREELIPRRDEECIRLDDCEERWLIAHAATNINAPARCPTGCLGRVEAGEHVRVIPLEALRRSALRVQHGE